MRDQILLQNPLPENFDNVKKLDDFIWKVLIEKNKQKDIDLDATLEMYQNKNSNIMGPISKLWMTTEMGRQAKKFPVPSSQLI